MDIVLIGNLACHLLIRTPAPHPSLMEGGMPQPKGQHPQQLEDVPNIGKSIAADLRRVGILLPGQLAEYEPLAAYRKLAGVMGPRRDPCVLYVLLAAKHFLVSGEALPWWKFTEQGKKLLAARSRESAEIREH